MFSRLPTSTRLARFIRQLGVARRDALERYTDGTSVTSKEEGTPGVVVALLITARVTSPSRFGFDELSVDAEPDTSVP